MPCYLSLLLSFSIPFLSLATKASFATTARSKTAGETTTTLIQDDSIICDERKCRASYPFPSERTNPNTFGYYSFFDNFCWSTSLLVDNPENCEEGYQPIPLPDAPPLPGFEGEDYVYFTCCPQPWDQDQNITQANTKITANNISSLTNHCDSTYVACRDDTFDCVIGTSYGFFDAIICDSKSPYRYPNVLAENGNLLLFACCDDYPSNDDDVQQQQQTYAWTTGLKLTVIPWLILSLVVFGFLSFLMIAMMSSRFVRKQSYNLYVLCLAIPDWILNLVMIVTSSMVIGNVKYDVNDVVTYINGSVWVANMWINTVVSYEVYRMVMSSHGHRRMNPPTARRIYLQCCTIYVASLVIMWLVTSGVEGSNPTVYTIATYSLLVMAAIPFIFIPYVTIRIYKTGLLSTTGQARAMTVYFGKIVLIFFGFSLPSLGITVSSGFNEFSPDMTYWKTPVSYQLVIIQGATSAAFAMTKPDIKKSVIDLMAKCKLFCCYRLFSPTTKDDVLGDTTRNTDAHPDPVSSSQPSTTAGTSRSRSSIFRFSTAITALRSNAKATGFRFSTFPGKIDGCANSNTKINSSNSGQGNCQEEKEEENESIEPREPVEESIEIAFMTEMEYDSDDSDVERQAGVDGIDDDEARKSEN